MPTLRLAPHTHRPLLALLLALALLLPTLALAPPARAADCLVTTGENQGNGSLRSAINRVDNFSASDCAHITFQAGLGLVTITSYLLLNRAVVIEGPGAGALTIRYQGDPQAAGSVFQITGGPAILRGLSIAGGRTQVISGAGLSILGSPNPVNVTLDKVVLLDNITKDAGGGGLYASNAVLAIIDSTIRNNLATGPFANMDGGGLFLDDYYGNVSATLTNTTISGNQATDDRGGGIRVLDRAAGKTVTLALNGSTVSGNTAKNTSGGIDNNGGIVTLTNSTLSGNTAPSGGGLGSAGGTTTLTGSTVNGNWASFDGGGLYNSGGALTLINSTVSGNAAAHDGGGFYTYSGTTTLTAVTLIANQAEDSGGGFFANGAVGETASVRIGKSIIAGNQVGNTPQDCRGINDALAPLTSDGDNLVGNGTGCPSNGTGDLILTAPLASVLDPTLANNGGATRTHTLVAGSPAIDHIPAARCGPTPDQRGIVRPQNGACDSGSVEINAAPPSPCGQRFGDVPATNPACTAIEALSARGIINGCDATATPPLFCPGDTTLRHQMAALIVRAMPGWSAETYPNSFTDPTEDAELWRRVGTLQHYGVVGGYTAASCQAQGKTPPCYGPLDPVLKAQAISFVTRAMVQKGYWVAKPANPDLFGGALTGTGHEADAATYWFYTRARGGVPDYPVGGGFPVGEAATRGWFARLLWNAIQGTPAAP